MKVSAGYAPELDGLRAVAVTLVVLYHLGFKSLGGGYIGVDVFFVLSGFLISRQIFQKIEVGRFSFLEFYGRRFFRLYPAIIVTILGSLTLGVLVSPPKMLHDLGLSSIWALFSAVNFRYYFQAGYWDQSSLSKPLLHLWSLSVEEQFYLAWPLILVLVSFMARSKKIFVFFLLILGLVSYMATIFLLPKDPPLAFYMMPLRLWEFALGGILAKVGFKARILQSRSLRTVLAGSGLLGCFLTAHFLSNMTQFPGANAVIPCLSSLLLIAFTGGSCLEPVFSNGVMTFVGKLSYAIYLVHWPIIVFYRDFRFNYFPASPDSRWSFSGIEVFTLVIVILLLAWCLKTFVEDPNRFVRPQVPSGWQRSRLIGAGVFCSVVLSVTVILTDGLPQRIDRPSFNAAFSAEEGHDCAFRMPKGRWEGACGIGVSGGLEPDVVLIGDSHMDHYMVGFDPLLRDLGLSGVMVTGGGTLPIPGGKSLVGGRAQAPFEDVFRKVLEQPPRLVILSARWDAHFKETIVDYPMLPNRFTYGSFSSTDVESSRKAVREGLSHLLAELNRRGISTLLLGPIPMPGKAVIDCLARPRYMDALRDSCLFVSTSDQLKYREIVQDTLQSSSRNLPNVLVTDPVAELCRKSTCEVFVPQSGKIIFRDTNHLSSAGARYLVSTYIRPYVEKALR